MEGIYQYIKELSDQGFFEAIGDGVSIQDTDYKVLYQNKIHKDFVGDHAGEYCYKAYEKNEDICEGCPVAKSFEDGKTHKAERAAPTDRGVLYFDITASPLKDSTGKIIAGIEIARNITERKKAEKELKQEHDKVNWQNELMQYIISHAQSCIAVHDRDLNYIFVSEKYLKEYKVKEKDVIGKHHYEIFPDLPQKWRDIHQRALLGEVLSADEDPYYRDDGSVDWTRWECRPWYNSDGSIGGIIVYTEIINDRMQAGDKLRESEEKYRDLFENASDPIFIVDKNQNYIDVNKKAIDLLGYSKKELLKTNILKLIPPDQVKRSKDILRLLNTEEGYKNFTGKMCAKDGRLIDVEVSSSAIKKEGTVVGSRDIVRDITERKQFEEEMLKSQKLDSVSILAGGIAHDFNNLLQSIFFNISLSKIHSDKDSAVFEALEETEKSIQKAKDLTLQLLTFSKGGLPSKETLSLSRIISEAVKFTLSGSNVKSKIVIKGNLYNVDVDEGQIHQVLNNFIINADHAMPDGGMLKVKAENVILALDKIPNLKEGKYVAIHIEDTGIGIASENISKVFDPFYSTKLKGSGLGLATSYSIINKHNGAITVDSEIDKGTIFTVYLPASEKKTAEKARTKEALLKGKGRVLVMDDNEGIIEGSKKLLSAMGYEADSALDGVEAIEKYTKAREAGKPYDVVMLDLTVPGGMGGREAIKKLLEIDPEVKAIVSSGYTDNLILYEHRKYGFKTMLTKPYNAEAMSKVLNEVISGND